MVSVLPFPMSPRAMTCLVRVLGVQVGGCGLVWPTVRSTASPDSWEQHSLGQTLGSWVRHTPRR